MREKQDAVSHGIDETGHEEFSHPAYGMISISQTSGEAVLVGSAVKHQHFVHLEIKEARRKKGNYSEFWHDEKTLCSIHLSHAQLAEMLFKTNTSGIPCTIEYAIGDEESCRPAPPFESQLKQQSDALSNILHETLLKAKELAKEAEELLNMKNPKKADKERAQFLCMKVVQDIERNMPFAMQVMDEKAEKNLAHAKSEIESFMNMKLVAAGLEHIKQGGSALLLEGDEPREGESK